jgi:CarD family transcriptional regulator
MELAVLQFNVGDTVLYGTIVCTLNSIVERNFGDGSQRYFVLKPVFDTKSTIYAQADNPATEGKIRRMLSKDEIHALINSMPAENTIWIEDDTERRSHYRQILASGDRTQLVQLIKTLHLRQEQLAETNAESKKGKRKLHSIDEQFMKDAENILYHEFAHVLQIEPDQVIPFITRQIDLLG